jgi:hypothetical protein
MLFVTGGAIGFLIREKILRDWKRGDDIGSGLRGFEVTMRIAIRAALACRRGFWF